MDKPNKEKILGDLLKLQTFLLKSSDLNAIKSVIEGFLRGSQLFDSIEIKQYEIDREKPEN